MADGNCEGCGTSSCCCGEITRIKGGIHPEHLRTTTRILRTNKRYQLLTTPSHLCAITMGIQVMAADKYATIRIFRSSDPDDPFEDDTVLMFSLVSGQGQIESSEHVYGLPFLNGMYAELIVQPFDADARIFINMTTVDRDNFSPAYQKQVDTLLYYWNCWRPGDNFLGDWDSGTSADPWSDGGGETNVDDTWGSDKTVFWEDEASGRDDTGHIIYRFTEDEIGDLMLFENSSLGQHV